MPNNTIYAPGQRLPGPGLPDRLPLTLGLGCGVFISIYGGHMSIAFEKRSV